jgi:predicted TIM-barrel fold metal-dependent hydrolase
VLNNPRIVPPKQFDSLMRMYINEGLEDRLMFGSDDADIKMTTVAVEQLAFLTAEQKNKIFYKNAEAFFKR